MPTYSIAFRVRRIIIQDAYLSVPIDAQITKANDDGTRNIDPEKLIPRVLQLAESEAMEWQTEEVTMEPHPGQRAAPEGRVVYRPKSEM